MTRAKKALSQAVLLISGAIMLGFGAMRGEVETVLSKAMRTWQQTAGEDTGIVRI